MRSEPNNLAIQGPPPPEVFNPEVIKEYLLKHGIDIAIRLKVGEAANWLRQAAPGRALEALEIILSLYEQQDRMLEQRPPAGYDFDRDGKTLIPTCNCE